MVGECVSVTSPLLAGRIWRPSRGRASDPIPMSLIHLCLQIEKINDCFQDLNRPSSRSKSDFLAWAAQTGQKKADFRGAIAQKRHEPSPFIMGGFDSYGSKEPKPTVATQPLTGSRGTSWSRPLPHAHSMHARFGGLPVGGRAI